MANPEGIGTRLARALLAKHPDIPALTAAKKLYKDNPAVWTSLETCRGCVRSVLGTKGQARRRDISDKSLYREPRKAGDLVFAKMPEPIDDIKDWKPYVWDVTGSVLVMSDVHLPYHDKRAVQSAIKEGKRRKVKSVLLDGDISDFYAVSFHETDPRKRDFAREIEMLREFFTYLRRAFPHAEILMKEGNHEERLTRYLMVKAPELLDLPEFNYGELSHANKLGITVVGEKRPVQVGKLTVLHGHEFRRTISQPVNPARGLFLRAGVSALQGDAHRTSNHSEPNLLGHLVTCWSIGCLCDLHPTYMPINKWNHGFAGLHIGQDGSYEVDNPRIIDGKVWR